MKRDYLIVWDTIESDVHKIISIVTQILNDIENEQNVE